jgi:phage terminase Nu1 subunit (DNA packaging protein)
MPIDSLEAALQWREEKDSGDSAERLRLARIQLVTEQTERVKIENRVRAGELVEVGYVHGEILRMVGQAKSEFLKLANDLPPRLAGLDEPRISRVIRDEVVAILTRLSDESTGEFPPVEK